jgi:outer membrane protein
MSPNAKTARPERFPGNTATKARLIGNTLTRLLGTVCVLATAVPLRAETLHNALLQAYQANPTLNAQRKSVLAISEDLNRAKAGYLPRISATADIGYYKEVDKYPPDPNLNPDSLKSPTNNTYSTITSPRGVSLNVNQTVFDGFRTGNSVLQAQAGILGAKAATMTVEQNTLFLAVSAYADVLTDTAILNRIQKSANALRAQMQLTEEKHCYGDVTKTDIAQVGARLAATKAQASTAEANLRTTVGNFRRVVGTEPRALSPPRAVDEFIPNNVDSVAKIALAANPAIHAAAYGIRTAALNAAIIHGEHLPTISVNGLLSERQDVSVRGDEQFVGAVVGRISIPLYSGGEVVARETQAKHIAGQRALETDAIRDQVRAAAVSTWAVFVAAKDRLANARTQLSAARTALEGIREQWSLGDRTMREVLDAEQEYLAAEINVTVAERDRIVATYALAQVMGKLTLATLGTLNLNSGRNPAFDLLPLSVKFSSPAKSGDGGTGTNDVGCEKKALGDWPLRLSRGDDLRQIQSSALMLRRAND